MHTLISIQQAKLDELDRICGKDGAQHKKVNLNKSATELLWNLLDYATSSSPTVIHTEQRDALNVDINTQFLSPVACNDNATDSRPDENSAGPGGLESFDDSEIWNTLGISDEPGVLFPLDFWIDGQL